MTANEYRSLLKSDLGEKIENWPKYRDFTVFSLYPLYRPVQGLERKYSKIAIFWPIFNFLMQIRFKKISKFIGGHFKRNLSRFRPILTKLSPKYVQNQSFWDFLDFPPSWDIDGQVPRLGFFLILGLFARLCGRVCMSMVGSTETQA